MGCKTCQDQNPAPRFFNQQAEWFQRPDSRRRFVVLLLGFPRLRSQKPPMATPTAFFRFSPSTQPSGFWVFKARAPDPTGLWLSSSVWSSTWIEVCLVLLRDDVSILPNWFNPPKPKVVYSFRFQTQTSPRTNHAIDNALRR